MSPNIDQILSVVRWLLSVGGPLGALLIARGMPVGEVTALQGSIIALVGALPPIVSFVWGMFAHTDSAKIVAAAAISPEAKTIAFAGVSDSTKLAAVAAMPDVEKIVVQAQAKDGVGTALADPAQTKVVSR